MRSSLSLVVTLAALNGATKKEVLKSAEDVVDMFMPGIVALFEHCNSLEGEGSA